MPVLGGRLPPKNQLLPPQIVTDFIFIHPEPPTHRLLPTKVLQLPPTKKKDEILQETLPSSRPDYVTAWPDQDGSQKLFNPDIRPVELSHSNTVWLRYTAALC